MLIQQGLLHIRQLRRKLAAEDPHVGDFLQHDRVVHRVLRVFTPGKRAVGVHQHAGHLRRVDSLFFEGFDNHVPCFPFVLTVDLRIGHQTRAGNGAVEVVRVGGAGGRNRLARLRPDGRVTRMGMHNPADGREGLIQQAMSGRIGGGLFIAFNHFTRFDADHHHIFCGHYRVIHAGRLDHEHPFFPVNGADVAPGQGYEVMFWQRQVGFEYLTFEIF